MVEPADIALLTIDALRADHLSCHGYDRETPTLDTLAEEWIHAPTTVSASLYTCEAMLALLTGRYPDIAVNTCDTPIQRGSEKTIRNSRSDYRLKIPRCAK